MTYNAIEIGPLGRPVEFYEFFQDGHFVRVTSADTPQVKGSDTFAPLPGLKRTEPTQGNEEGSGEIRVVIPATFPLALQFRGTLPSSMPSLTIYQKHLNDGDGGFLTIWKGQIVTCAFGDGKATFHCLPITRLFKRSVPRAVFSGLCNSQLYDEICQANRLDFRFVGSLTSILSDGVTIDISGLRVGAAAINTAQSLGLSSTELDNFFNRGYISTTEEPGELRTIVETDVGGDPDVVRINIPFAEADAGTSCEVYAGCNHSIDICNRKFKNAINFDGFPYVPGSINNPFTIDLSNGGTKTSSGTSSRFGGSKI